MVKSILSEDEAAQLIDKRKIGHNKKWDNPIIAKVLKAIEGENNCKIKKGESYWKVESVKKGHQWHYDTGNNKHMLWCGLSCTILLSKPESFDGGLVHFRDKGKKNKKTYTSEEHYLNGILYSSIEEDELNEHMVEPHNGSRYVLLLFLEI